MAKFFLFLTILAAGAAAFLGFQTKGKLDSVQAIVTKSKSDLTAANQKLTTATSERDKAKQAEAAANEAKAVAEAANSKAQNDLQVANTALNDAKNQLADAQKQVEELKVKVAAGTTTGTNGVPVPQVDPEMVKKLTEAEAKVQELTTINATLQSKTKEQDEKVATLTKAENDRKGKLMIPGLEGQVMAVNQGWNFVVISLGDRQGAVANANLIVKRGDTMIGKLKISSVEPSTSIADIVPDSVPKGQRILPGDRVIYPSQ